MKKIIGNFINLCNLVCLNWNSNVSFPKWLQWYSKGGGRQMGAGASVLEPRRWGRINTFI